MINMLQYKSLTNECDYMYIWPDKEIPQNKTLLMGLIVFSIWFNAIDFYSILYGIILL